MSAVTRGHRSEHAVTLTAKPAYRENQTRTRLPPMSKDPKDRHYWIDEIAFLEARLNGSQGDIDKDDRAACEDALKAAKANLAACQ